MLGDLWRVTFVRFHVAFDLGLQVRHRRAACHEIGDLLARLGVPEGRGFRPGLQHQESELMRPARRIWLRVDGIAIPLLLLFCLRRIRGCASCHVEVWLIVDQPYG